MTILNELFMQEAWALTWVEDILGSEKKAWAWYTTPNPSFGGTSACGMIFRFRGHKVLQFVIEVGYCGNLP